MNIASEDGQPRWSKLLLFSFALLFAVRVARAQTADVCAAAIESGATVVTNTAQFASLFEEWAVNYPLVYPYEPATFEGMDAWWVDLNQLTNALAAVRSYRGREIYGVTEWPLRLIRVADTGQIVVKCPESDLELLRLEAPTNYVPFQQYDRMLRSYCILGLVMNPTNYDALIDQGYTYLDPPRIVLDVWLADLNDWPTYQSNVVAEAEAESVTAPTLAAGGMFTAMTEDVSSDPCVITNETDSFAIGSITSDTNGWATITWLSCTDHVYAVCTTEELSDTNVWTSQQWMWGADGTTSWTDTNAPAFPSRFYRVVRANPNTLNNGIPYGWAVTYGLDPLDPNLAFEDPDGDCFINLEEYQNGTNPLNPDPRAIIASSTVCAGSTTNTALTTASVATLHSFSNSGVTLGVIQGSGNDTSFYGINNDGLFKMSADGNTVTNLFQFGDSGITNGYYASVPIQGSDGNLYGVTWVGGNTNVTNYCLEGWYGYGTVYRISTNGAFTTLHVFGGMALNQYGGTPEGAQPIGQLVEGRDGNFYGVTEAGGVPDCADSWCCSSGFGTVFRVTPQGALTNLYKFTGGADGADPRAGLVQGSDGFLYGTTSAGTGNAGTIFKVGTNGDTFTTLHPFTGGDDGATPLAALVQDSSGNLYGTTYGGGTYGLGTVFTITTNGTLTVLHSFAGSPEGAYPATSLVRASDGNFYGTTVFGGSGHGTLFRITPQGALTTVYQFTGATDGTDPDEGGLVQGADGFLYGTTLFGGSGGAGTVFKVGPGTYSLTYTWSITNGTITAGQGSQTIMFSAASPCSMTISVTATNSFGCSSSSSASVSVTAPPPSANSPINAGDTLNLSVPTVAGATYSWTGPAEFTSTNQSPSISDAQPCSSGQYCVSVTANGCTTLSNCVSVTVNTPQPTSNGPLCAGDTLYLSITNFAGATYNWTGPGWFSSTNQNPSVTNVTTEAAGDYCVTVTATNGCVWTQTCVAVTVNPLPTAFVSGTTTTGPQCGVTIQAALTGTGPWTVTWSDGLIQSNVTVSPAQRTVNPSSTTNYTVTALSDANCSGSSFSGSATVTVSTNTTSSVVVSNEVLVIYNSNTNFPHSLACANYYISHRPGFSDANVLGCACTPFGVDGFESITLADLTNQIINPIINFIQSNQTKSIHYVVLMYGMPSRVSDGPHDCSPYRPSVQHHISRCMSDVCNPSGASYEGSTCPFVATNYPGTTCLVTALNMATLADCTAYVDKVTSMYTGDVIISAKAAGYANDNYYLDDTGGSGGYIPAFRTAILTQNPGASVIYSSNAVISTGSNIKGYVGWGIHNGIFTNTYAVDGEVVWSGSSTWWIIETIESFNGQRGCSQGCVERWFAPNAWGGTNYTNTPVGAVSHVEEPLLGNENGATYMSLWESGFLFSECAWASKGTQSFQAIGDPLIKQ